MIQVGAPDETVIYKKILITAHNALGIVASDPVDSLQIFLSKNNGFVQVFDLFTFPYHGPDSVYAEGLDYLRESSELSDDEKRLILGESSQRLFHIDGNSLNRLRG